MSGRCLSSVLRSLPALLCAGLMLLMCVAVAPGISPAVPFKGNADAAAGPTGLGDSNSREPRLTGLVAGWKGTIVPGPPGPWRLEISCGDKPVDATVMMSFRQDSTQKTETSQRVALVPGRVARVEFAAAVAERDAEIRFVLQDSSGRQLDDAKAETNPFGAARFTYDLPYYHFNSVVLFVGRRINPPAATDNRGFTPTDELGKDYVRSRCLFKIIEPAELPIDPASYGGVAGVVLDQTDLQGLEPARLAALRDYLATGGNVSLVTSIAGDGWQLLAGFAPLSTSGSQVIGVPTPVVLAQAEPMGAAKLASLLASSSPAGGVGPKPVTGDAQVLVRFAEVTTLGRDEGWLVWPVVSPVLARGPIGLGQLTLWLVSPTLLGATVEAADRDAVWNAVLLAAGIAPADPRRPIEQRSWHAERGEAPSLTLARTELMGIMPKLSMSHTLAWIFGGIMLALALLVGIGDSKLHRRDKRPRAYFTCALWIVLACVLAVVLPRFLGSRAAFSLRVSEMEQVCDPAAPLAWSVTAHAILADQATAWSPPVTGSFCHGFDLLEPRFARDSERFAVPTIELATVASAFGVVTRPVSPLSVRRSAIHCLLEMQTGKPTFTAATTTDAQGRPTIRLAGFRSGDQIVSAALLYSAAIVQPEDSTADAAGTVTLEVTLPESASDAGSGSAAAVGARSGRLITVNPAQTSRAAQLARAAGGRYVIVRFQVRSTAIQTGSNVSIDAANVTLHVPVTGWPEAVATSLAREAKVILSSERSAMLEWKARSAPGDDPAAGNLPGMVEPALRINKSLRGGGVKDSNSAVPNSAVPNFAAPNSAAPNSAAPNSAVPNSAVPNSAAPAPAATPASPVTPSIPDGANTPVKRPEPADVPPELSENVLIEELSFSSTVQRQPLFVPKLPPMREAAEQETA